MKKINAKTQINYKKLGLAGFLSILVLAVPIILLSTGFFSNIQKDTRLLLTNNLPFQFEKPFNTELNGKYTYIKSIDSSVLFKPYKKDSFLTYDSYIVFFNKDNLVYRVVGNEDIKSQELCLEQTNAYFNNMAEKYDLVYEESKRRLLNGREYLTWSCSLRLDGSGLKTVTYILN